MKAVMTIRIEPELKQKLGGLAQATARTQSYLVSEAIREYVEVNEWQVAAIQQGVRQADDGKLIPHDEIRAKWEAKLAR